MSAQTFRVEIANGQVKLLDAKVLPLSGQGILTLVEPHESAPLKKVEMIDGPDGIQILRGGGVITSEMVRELENEPW